MGSSRLALPALLAFLSACTPEIAGGEAHRRSPDNYVTKLTIGGTEVKSDDRGGPLVTVFLSEGSRIDFISRDYGGRYWLNVTHVEGQITLLRYAVEHANGTFPDYFLDLPGAKRVPLEPRLPFILREDVRIGADTVGARSIIHLLDVRADDGREFQLGLFVDNHLSRFD